MNQEQTLEIIPLETLLDRVRGMRAKGYRLVQIGATRLPEQVEMTYSFDLKNSLANLRFHVPAAEARIPSISSIYACSFLYENELHDLFNIQVEGMSVDFKGNFYKTAVKYPFGSTKAPAAQPATAASTPLPAGTAPVAGTPT
ncbi:MAG TPA: NADH-quinone oxidoreductase subunit C [Verrucomicrobiae bacterium]|nr:NADH-quinone oxidoreductase subunit C [Verrucomicrobiae bacterium]